LDFQLRSKASVRHGKTVTKLDSGVFATEENMSVVPMSEIEASGNREFEKIFNEYSRIALRSHGPPRGCRGRAADDLSPARKTGDRPGPVEEPEALPISFSRK
jgi:hypothetical protein